MNQPNEIESRREFEQVQIWWERVIVYESHREWMRVSGQIRNDELEFELLLTLNQDLNMWFSRIKLTEL